LLHQETSFDSRSFNSKSQAFMLASQIRMITTGTNQCKPPVKPKRTVMAMINTVIKHMAGTASRRIGLLLPHVRGRPCRICKNRRKVTYKITISIPSMGTPNPIGPCAGIRNSTANMSTLIKLVKVYAASMRKSTFVFRVIISALSERLTNSKPVRTAAAPPIIT
jgi:hypothetical protein